MSEPTIDRPDERGTRWLQQTVLETLARDSELPEVQVPTCTWGTSFETRSTLYLWLPGEAEPKALRFTPALISDCGAGHRARQSQAITTIRRMLKQLGLLAASDMHRRRDVSASRTHSHTTVRGPGSRGAHDGKFARAE